GRKASCSSERKGKVTSLEAAGTTSPLECEPPPPWAKPKESTDKLPIRSRFLLCMVNRRQTQCQPAAITARIGTLQGLVVSAFTLFVIGINAALQRSLRWKA